MWNRSLDKDQFRLRDSGQRWKPFDHSCKLNKILRWIFDCYWREKRNTLPPKTKPFALLWLTVNNWTPCPSQEVTSFVQVVVNQNVSRKRFMQKRPQIQNMKVFRGFHAGSSLHYAARSSREITEKHFFTNESYVTACSLQLLKRGTEGNFNIGKRGINQSILNLFVIARRNMCEM